MDSLIEQSSLVNPYTVQELECRVLLYPNQMNNNLYSNLKKNLINLVEGKCNKYGYIHKIYKITDYSSGMMEPEIFSGAAVYNIRYIANIYIVITKTQIIVKIDKIANDLILGINGPIKCVIKMRDINSKNFDINSNYQVQHIESKKILSPNDHIKVTIISHAFHAGETSVPAMGYIDNLPTNDEINNFFNNQHSTEKDKDEHSESIEFNDDKEALNVKEIGIYNPSRLNVDKLTSNKSNYID